MKQKGFTLIELLVVITIIAVLSAAGLVSYQSAGKRSRDARRIEDLKEIQKGLEQYYAKNSSYPSSADCAQAFADDFFPQGKPQPPVGGNDTIYHTACTATGYKAYIETEDVSNANATNGCGVFGGDVSVYCVVSLQ